MVVVGQSTRTRWLIAERLYVKRAIGFPSEVIRFREGNVEVRPAGSAVFTKESDQRSDLSLAEGPHRSIDSTTYEGIKAWGALFGYQESNLNMQAVPTYLKNQYLSVQGDSYPDDYFQFETQNPVRNICSTPLTALHAAIMHSIRTASMSLKAISPLGDNRDNSRSRYFGLSSRPSQWKRPRFLFWRLHE